MEKFSRTNRACPAFLPGKTGDFDGTNRAQPDHRFKRYVAYLRTKMASVSKKTPPKKRKRIAAPFIYLNFEL
jgi:hypothetical protein